MVEQFTDTERAILRLVQASLPDSLTPYADIAKIVGVAEGDVLSLLLRLQESGAIRRFGASVKHQKTGWSNNAMVAWCVEEHLVDAAGKKAAEHAQVSHCYYRPSSATDWPYELYTMVHGRSEEDCQQVIATLQETMGLTQYSVLLSIKECKKTSMTYF